MQDKYSGKINILHLLEGARQARGLAVVIDEAEGAEVVPEELGYVGHPFDVLLDDGRKNCEGSVLALV